MTALPLFRLSAGVTAEGTRKPFFFWKDEINIGRRRTNHLVLGHESVDDLHARIVARDGLYVVVDLRSAGGTSLNGQRIDSATIVWPSDVLTIGAYTIELLDRDPPIDVERSFLEAIERSPADDDTRAVYADWLEEHGRPEAAELLRAQAALKRLAPRDARFQELTGRVRDLAGGMPLAWRRTVAQLPIENCSREDAAALRFDFVCPQRWDALAPGPNPSTRHCDACNKEVHYAPTVPVARRLALAGHCVAVDVRPEQRRPGDLEDAPVVRTAGMMVSPRYRGAQ